MELKLENVSIKYINKNLFLKNIKSEAIIENFDETFNIGVNVIIGSNGSGKTSLLRAMAGITMPNSGRILFNGEEIVNMGAGYRDIIGYLPQKFGVYKFFTAKKFLMYIGKLKGLEKSFAADRTKECLKLVNLEEYADVKLYKFSGGMKQRIGIAQALMNEPNILILDEPTAGLDIKERINFRNIISELGESKIVIFSTHILSDLDYIVDRIINIR